MPSAPIGLAEETHEELVVAGARPRRIALEGRDALTASERRVADLAAEGKTNKDIAQALFLSVKTSRFTSDAPTPSST